MSVTDPWREDSETRLRYPAQHTYSLRIFEDGDDEPPTQEITGLEVIACDVAYDHGWTPYVQGRATLKMPSADVLAKLDPRLLIEVDVYAGYVAPDGTSDSHLMCRTMLNSRTANHAEGTLDIQFQGLEFIFDDDLNLYDGSGAQEYSNETGWTSSTKVADAMFDVLEVVNAWTVAWASLGESSTATGWVSPYENWRSSSGENRLGLLREIAIRTDGWFRCSEFGTWLTTPWPPPMTPPVHYLRTGADGTLVTTDTLQDREGFYNVAMITWHYTVAQLIGNGVVATEQRQIRGYAEFDDGPYTPLQVGRVPYTADRLGPTWGEGASVTAGKILSRLWERSDLITVTAIAAYWVRPGHYLDLQLNDETVASRYLVHSATYDLTAGTMSLTLAARTSTSPPFTIAIIEVD